MSTIKEATRSRKNKTPRIKVGPSDKHDWHQKSYYHGYSFVLDLSLMEKKQQHFCRYQVTMGFCKFIKDNLRFYVKISDQ